jgi:hypothetical protein
MNGSQFRVHLLILSVMFAVNLLPLENAATPPQAPHSDSQIFDRSSRTSDRVQFVQPEWAKRGAPGSRRGGASRNPEQCPTVTPSLTALVPGIDPTAGQPTIQWSQGLTSTGHPTFWFYVPYTAPLTAEFVLQDKQGTEFVEQYQQTVLLPTKPGIVSVALPVMVKSLEVGKVYRWVFSIVCNRQSRSSDVSVSGRVQRVSLSPTLTRQIEAAPLHDRVLLYAANGIWYEPLTLVGDRLFSHSQNLPVMQDWTDLLSSVGLESVANAPIVQRYAAAKSAN